MKVDHSSRSEYLVKLCMSSDSFPCLIFDARYQKTNNNASIVLDLREPFGPTMDEKD